MQHHTTNQVKKMKDEVFPVYLSLEERQILLNILDNLLISKEFKNGHAISVLTLSMDCDNETDLQQLFVKIGNSQRSSHIFIEG